MILAKRQITLFWLYFVPLAVVRDRREFRQVLAVALSIHALIGLQTLRSGILAGPSFGDHKRGAGPFGSGWLGTDVAGAYLAEMLMLFVGFVVTTGAPMLARMLAFAGGGVVFLGLLATYSRGSLLAAGGGCLLMIGAAGLRLRTLLLLVLVVLGGFAALPESTLARLSATFNEEGQLDTSSTGRFGLYAAAWDAFKDHPLGAGTGQIMIAMTFKGYPVDPHNGYLYTLVEHGIHGVVVFLWLWLALLLTGRWILRYEPADWAVRGYGLGFCGLIGALLICNVFYANVYKELVIGSLTLHMGLLAWAYQATLAEREAPETDGEPWPDAEEPSTAE
jgi:O-antigen ligase